jgi:DNA-binding protein YbaB
MDLRNKERILRFQKETKEVTYSSLKEISITINGSMEILEITIAENIDKQRLEQLLKEAINTAIKSMALKLNNEILRLQRTGR